MHLIGLTGHRASLRAVKLTNIQWQCFRVSTSCLRTAQRTVRWYTTPRPQSELVRRARAAAVGAKMYEIPERLIIYHAGTGRITFLAMLKLTSLLVGAFFTFLVVPGYVNAEKPIMETAAVALAGIIPILFIGYTTAPFVTHMYIHLPPSARASRAALERFVGGMPASTPLTLTTMSAIGKPRYSRVGVGDLRCARGRLGLVNWVRDAAGENGERRWFMYRAVGGFYVQEGSGRVRVRGGKGVVDGWIWDAIRGKAGKVGKG